MRSAAAGTLSVYLPTTRGRGPLTQPRTREGPRFRRPAAVLYPQNGQVLKIMHKYIIYQDF